MGRGVRWAGQNQNRKRRWVDRAYDFSTNAAAASGAYNTAAAPSAGSMARAHRKFRSVSTLGKRSFAYKRSRIGRNRARLSNLCETAVLRLQGINVEVPNEDPDDGTVRYPGFYPMSRGATADVNSLVPFYYVDLTRINNSNLGGIATECVGQMQLNDIGAPSFLVRNTQASSGTTMGESSWQGEKSSGTVLSNFLAKYVQTNWYDIRFKLYGARKQTVTYNIWLCRFREDHMCPNGPLPQDSKDQGERNAMYSSWVRPAITNTIFPSTSGWLKKVQVLRSAKYTIQPSYSTELERNPDSVDLKWFVRDSKIRLHAQNQNNLGTDVLQLDTTAWNVESTSQWTNDPAYQRSRLFLFIRATDMTPTVTGDDQDDTPSFDMCIRKKVSLFPPT